MNKLNIFIEGIQGSGKSTLLNALAGRLDGFRAWREGDVTPLELAWCSYMTPEQYAQALEDMPEHRRDIERRTERQGGHFVTAYTQVRTDDWPFYQYMEKYEIYSGRLSPAAFSRVILERFEGFRETGCIFECAFLQNIVEELMLYAMYSDEQIVAFYRQLIDRLDLDCFRLIRILPDDPAASIARIRDERTDENGEQRWYNDMMAFLNGSPYGQAHGYHDFDDLIAHFERRISIENRVIAELPEGCCLELKSRAYTADDVLAWLDSGA